MATLEVMVRVESKRGTLGLVKPLPEDVSLTSPIGMGPPAVLTSKLPKWSFVPPKATLYRFLMAVRSASVKAIWSESPFHGLLALFAW